MKNFIFLIVLLIVQSAIAESSDDCKTPEDLRNNPDCFSRAMKGIKPLYIDGSYEAKKITPEEIFSHVDNTAILMDFQPNVEPVVHEKCDPAVMCRNPSQPLSEDNTDILKKLTETVTNSENSINKDECACLGQRFYSEYGPELEGMKKQEKEKINKKILEAYSRKFLNDFSVNLEDASFFLTKNADMFKDGETAKQLQCNNSTLYDGMIKTICDKKGIVDTDFIEKRKKYFLNSLSPDRSDFSFEDRLNDLSDDIQSIFYRVPGKDQPSVFTRYEYDNGRIGLAHETFSGIAIDHIVTTIMKDPQLMARLEELRSKEDTTPVMSILALVEEQKSKPSFISKFKKDTVRDILANSDELKDAFRFLMNTHPGFMNSMQNPMVFDSLKEHFKSDGSVLNTLEKNPAILEPVLSARCNNMMVEFANAVCTKDEDLISKMDPQDLSNLIHYTAKKGEDDNELHELLACEVSESSRKGGFNSLSGTFLPATRKADYLERLREKDLSKHTNSFTRTFLANQNAGFRQKMAAASESGAKISRSVSAGGLVATRIYAQAVLEGNAFSFGKEAMSKEEAKHYISESKKYDLARESRQLAKEKTKQDQKSKKETAKEIANNNSSNTTNSTDAAPVKGSVAPVKMADPVRYSSATQARAQLSRQLSRTNPSSEVERVVSKVDNSSAEELNRLRNSEASLLQRTYELESQRMEMMQKRVEELQSKIDKSPAPVQKTISQKSDPSTEEFYDQKSPRRKNSNAVVNIPVPTDVKPTNSQVPQGIASTEPVADGKEVSNGRGAPSPLSNDTSAPVTESSIRIESSKEKIREEVAKLIDNPEIKLSSLEEIKSNGIRLMIDSKDVIVKFEDLDQKTKDLLELKFAKKDRDAQVSKLAVLRILMSQKTR